jgi:Tol biopolymer transport system component
MRAIHGLLCGSLLLTGCMSEGTEDVGAPIQPVAPGPAEPGDPPVDPPPAPPADPHQVPFAPDALGQYDFAYVAWNGGAEIRFGNLRGEWSSVHSLEGGVLGAGTLALSPTGRQLAFETFDYVHGAFSLHVLALDTFEDRALAFDARSGLRPTWSPDGTRLLYFRWSPTGLDLQMVDAAGGAAPVTVGHTPSWGYEAFLGPDWSSDGREIFYSTFDRIVAHDVVTGAERDVVVAEGDEALVLPRLSPDGCTLVYVHGTTLALVPRAGGTPRTLAQVRDGASRLVWRPDSTALALVDDLFAVGGVGNELRVVGLDGSATHVDWLRSGIGAGDPEWSPDGGRLLYATFAVRDQGTNAWLRVFDARTSVAVDLGLRGAGYAVTYPTWLRPVPDEQN